MKYHHVRNRLKMWSVVVVWTAMVGTQLFAQAIMGRTFSMNSEVLMRIRREIADGNKTYAGAVKRLQKDADKVLSVKIGSVMDKDQVAPSGDKHDYLSYGRYYWPDPSRPDGLPYIQRDGESNPEIQSVTDQENLQRVIKSVHTLGLAYFYRSDEEYAERAAQILRMWFLDSTTRMNPSVNFGQVVKGKNVGRASGMIEMRDFARLLDGVGLLANSRSWTMEDQKGLVAWFSEYLTWLQTSKIGTQEAQSENNHGVWFDVQRSSIALFVGKADLARAIIEEAKEKRIARQIEPDGTQPRELARTRSMHYTAFNLDAFVSLALIGDHLGIDLWHYRTNDGRSIRAALDWFFPYFLGEKPWEHQQIDAFKKESFFSMLHVASIKFGDGKYTEAGSKALGEKALTDRTLLMFGAL